ncbi:MAG TPA: hypothetical protein ENN84_05020, partial [Candidatus Marinimicrobia bacterium]|nr:hypothetical protein [Candidatus Neomarinimicrobiota bacterium]
MKKRWIWLLLIFILQACEDPFHQKLPDSNISKTPPETHLQFFFEPDTTLYPGDTWIINGDTVTLTDTFVLGLDTTVSRKILHWWGDDPDGEVIAYYYQWSWMPEKRFTVKEMDTFYLPLKSAFDLYTFKVWAMDNDSLIDPTPAIASFPVINSPPSIEWKLNTLPPVFGSANVTHLSFSHHSFFWDVSDLDGLETITEILWALDDTSNWSMLPGDARSILLKELSPGYHRFYVKAKDVAGAESGVISFPDSLDDQHPNLWLVKEQVGDILIVNDYSGDQLNFTHQNFYKSVMTELVGENGFSVWEIGAGRTNVHNSIPYATEDIELNLSYFSKVFWFTYRGANSVSEAALALTRFVADGGILFMNNAMKAEIVPDTSWTFTQIDSVYSFSATGRLFNNTKINAFWNETDLDTSLQLSLSSNIADRLWAIIPGAASKLRYQLEDGSLNSSDYIGTPPVMIETQIKHGKTFYFSLPLYN